MFRPVSVQMDGYSVELIHGARWTGARHEGVWALSNTGNTVHGDVSTWGASDYVALLGRAKATMRCRLAGGLVWGVGVGLAGG